MHIFTAAIATETNSFSPIPTSEANFADDFYPAGTLPDRPMMFAAPMQVVRRRAAEQGWKVTEGLATSAQPSGLIRRATWESYRDRILADLAAAGPVDMVLLGLHGAMMADGYPDCEGDLLSRVRAIVGGKTVIGGLLDPHCHLTPAMLEAADVLIAYKHYPHLDAFDRAEELWSLCEGAATGRLRPVMASADCRMISLYYTPVEPVSGFVAAMTAAEQEPGVLSVSLIHGFPWGDVAEMGTRMLVIADGDAGRAQSLAEGFAKDLQAMKGRTMTTLIPIAEAVAAASGHEGPAPMVLADFADNCGAGAPSDATWLLDALIRADVPDVGIAFLHDPQAIDLCKAAGVGARMPLRVGGKTSRFSGPPLDLDIEVMHIAEDVRMKIGDIVSGGQIRTRAIVMQQKTGRPVQFEVLPDARGSLLAWLERRCGTVEDYVFPSRVDRNGHLSTRQYARLVDEWVTGIGLMRSEYGTHSLRRTKASIIYRATGNLRAVQILLGHSKIENTVRYLGIDVEDALALAENTEI